MIPRGSAAERKRDPDGARREPDAAATGHESRVCLGACDLPALPVVEESISAQEARQGEELASVLGLRLQVRGC